MPESPHDHSNDDRPPTLPSSTPANDSPSSPPSTSNSLPPTSPSPPINPYKAFFPPIDGKSISSFTSHLPSGPPSDSIASTSTLPTPPSPPRIPERCWTFCTQDDGGQTLCRMFCMRKKEFGLDKAGQLARLRPQSRKAITEENIAISSSATTTKGFWSSFSPFESLQRKVAPYSFVYVKGTLEGVVGRYMEEMEFDDGERDFGDVSRASKRRNGVEEEGYQRLDWGEHGTLIHLPLISLFRPIISIPSTLSKITSPPLHFLEKYIESFKDGSQLRTLDRLSTEFKEGGALKLLARSRDSWGRRMENAVKEEMEKREKVGSDEGGKGVGGVDVAKEAEGGKGSE